MANTITTQLLNTLRNQILTSLYGRRDGLDPNEYNLGPKDFRVQIENITTTAATTLSNFGISVLSCTVASSATYTMTNMAPGIQGKQIVQTSTSTLGYVVQLGALVNLVTTAGTSANQITFQSIGAAVELCSLSSLTYTMKFTPNTGIVLSTF